VSLSVFDLRSTPDRALLEALKDLSARGAEIEADLLVHLGEIDARGLALELGCGSLFAYCVDVLHFSESAAYNRIGAARGVRRFPQILERLRCGDLHLSGLRLLLPVLTTENCEELLDLARHQSKRAIEVRLADRAPKLDAPTVVRRLPERVAVSKPLVLESLAPATPAAVSAGPSARSSTEPLGGSRYKVQFTAAPEMHAKLREAQALLRHQIPDGDLGRIFDRALDALLRDVRRAKFADAPHPRAERAEAPGSVSRHIPAAIRRVVAKRDGERCTFVSDEGRRCSARDALEFHHVEPFAYEPRHRLDGITLRCRAHNALAATHDFGAAHMAQFRREDASTATRPGASS
jgi:hypothetical protein